MKTKIRQITWTGKRMNDAAYLLAVGVMALCCCCNGDHATEPSPSTPISLTGTKWKMAGYFDMRSRILTEAEPKNCERCYTLNFYSDSVAYGKSVANEVRLCLSPKLLFGPTTYVGDNHHGNVQLLYDAMRMLDSYTIENGELKLFYNNRRNYLLYKLIQ